MIRDALVPCAFGLSAGRRRVAVLLGFALAGVSTTQADVGPDALPNYWESSTEVQQMADGSLLTEYIGETRALDGREARLRVSFIPRFGCSPSISLLVDNTIAAQLSNGDPGGAGLADDDLAPFLIDEAAVRWPVIVDEIDGSTHIAYDSAERDRMTLRLQLDVGDQAAFGLEDDAEPLVFSLLGSRRNLASVQSSCRRHTPLPYEPKPDAD